MRSRLCIFLSLIILFTVNCPAFAYAAPDWPEDVTIAAESGILMDAGSGAVLYGKNIHEHYYPASITKILTALIIIEKCNLDDTVTFSHEAVYNVEKGSTSAGYDEGDKITVRQALYAMLLKSANEVANALAEHCAGSIEKFADMMNEKAKELGCTDSHFSNPSGLNDENHYTSPYDFALIAKAAFNNPVFVEFDSTTYYELPANSKNHDAFTVYCGHKMLKKSSDMYYPGIIGGKTGYTTLAGNTLVTCAERDGMKLISVILNGHQTHYEDTRTLLDFGFANFKNVCISDYDTSYTSVQDDINLTGSNDEIFRLDSSGTVTLPKEASLSDADSKITYGHSDKDPDNSVGVIRYTYDNRPVGSTFLLTDKTVSKKMEESTPKATPADSSVKKILKTVNPMRFPVWARILVFGILAAAGLYGLYRLLKYIIARKEERELSVAREARRQKRIESGAMDEMLKDSSASVNSYLKDTRTRRKKPFKGFGHRNKM